METAETATATEAEAGAHAELVAEVATQLTEHEPQPLGQIKRAVRALGPERVQVVLARTLEVEQQGGMVTKDGSRRRTPGGVFFFLLHEGLTYKQRGFIFGWPPPTPRPDSQAPAAGAGKEKVAKVAEKPAPVVDATVLWSWDGFEALAVEAMAAAGEATTVKLTLVGRPGKVQERGEVVLFGMVSEKAPALPKGVPAPEGPTKYAVLLATKQWLRVAPALQADPNDRLIVEGYPTVSERFTKGILVHATTATTVQLQASKRAAQQEAGAAASAEG